MSLYFWCYELELQVNSLYKLLNKKKNYLVSRHSLTSNNQTRNTRNTGSWLYVCKWSEFWFQYSWRWRHLQKIKTADSTFAQNPDAINVCRSSRESIHNTRLKNYSAGFNHAEWWRTDWGRRTTCWVKNRCCPVPDRNWPVQWPPHSPALLASLPAWMILSGSWNLVLSLL